MFCYSKRIVGIQEFREMVQEKATILNTDKQSALLVTMATP